MEDNTGTYGTITLAQCVSSAKMMLRIENADNDIWFGKLGNDAIRRLNTTSTVVKKQCTLEVVDSKATLPDDYKNLIGLRIGILITDPNGISTSNFCAGMTYVDTGFLSTCGCNANGTTIQSMQGFFQINNGVIIFYGDLKAGSTVDIAYFANNVDENGLHVVYERYEDAITSYICYNYTLSNPEKYNQYVITEHKMNFQAQKRMLKAYDARQSFRNTRAQMMEVANAIIVDKTWNAI